MADPATAIPGVFLREVNHETLVIIDMATQSLFGDGAPGVAHIGTKLGLGTQAVFDKLVDDPLNAELVRRWYRRYVLTESPSLPNNPFVDIRFMRWHLRRLGEQAIAVGGGWAAGITKRYMSFEVPRDMGAIALPLTPAFTQLLQLTADRQARIARLRQIQPDLEELDRLMKGIATDGNTLAAAIKELREKTKEGARCLAIATALEGLLSTLIKFPRTASTQELANLDWLRTQIRRLQNELTEHLIAKPVLHLDVVKKRDDAASSLLQRLEDPKLVDKLKTMFANWRIVGPNFIDDHVCAPLQTAFEALLVTGHGERVVKEHILPMINAAARKLASKHDLASVSIPGLPELEAAIRNEPVAISGKGPLSVMAVAASGLMQLVGNVNGPSNLVVSLLRVAAAPLLASHLIRSTAASGSALKLGGQLFRAVVQLGDLDGSQILKLINSINGKQLVRARTLLDTGASKVMTRPAWGALYAAMNAIVFLSVVTDFDGTTKAWLSIASSATGIGLGAASVANMLRKAADLLAKGIVQRGLNVAGAAAALASTIVAAIDLADAFGEHDTGAIVAGLFNVVGGVVSTLGFVVSALGTGGGPVLMAIGAGLLFVGYIISVVASPHSARGVFEAYMKEIEASGEFRVALTVTPSLRQVWSQCNDKSAWTFFFVREDHETGDILRQLGFSEDAIVRIGGRSNVAAPAH